MKPVPAFPVAFLALVLSLAPPQVVRLAAQERPELEAVRGRVAPEVSRELTVLVNDAARRGLPASALIDKALEGAAKHVPPALVIGALRELASTLRQAQSLLGGDPGHLRYVEGVAIALQRNAPPEAVRRLAAGASPREDLGATMNVLADLASRGVAPATAENVLLAWRAQGADVDALRRIPLVVTRLIRDGALPAQAAQAVEGALRRGGPPESVGPPAGVGPPRGRPPGRS